MQNRAAQLLMMDVGREILEKARSAKADAGKSMSDYDKGRQFAFYEVVSLLMQQANAFGIDLSTVGLADVDPEQDLL